MRHNVKTILWTAAILVPLAGALAGTPPSPLEVTADDLAAAGVADAVAVAPASDRFLPPVRYFRSSERLSEADAKKDCADCADLIAVTVLDSPSIPAWVAEKNQQFVKVGGRLQLRAWIAAKRRVVTVTAVNEQTLRKVSAALVKKFSE